MIAAGGTLGAMLPPSTVLAVYGIITEQDIGKLFIAGIVPGLLAMTMYMITIAVIGCRAARLPAGRAAQLTGASGIAGLKDIWAPLLLFVFVIGGLYGLPFLPRSRRPRPAASAPAAPSSSACSPAGSTKDEHPDARCCRRRAPPRRCSPC